LASEEIVGYMVGGLIEVSSESMVSAAVDVSLLSVVIGMLVISITLLSLLLTSAGLFELSVDCIASAYNVR